MKKTAPPFYLALDIGSKKMTLAATPQEKEGQRGPIFIETQESQGIFKGVVNDLPVLSEAVQQLFKKMERRTAFKAVSAALSINGNYITARHSSAALALSERGTRSIARRDIERLNAQARTLGLELDEYLLHEYPQGYSIDRHNLTLNPLGLHGRKFEGKLLLICAASGYLENITKAVEQAGLDVVRVAFAGVAAAEAVLSCEEKEKGAILIDIGDALTGVLIFKDGVVKKMNVLSFGGKNLSEIISNYYQISMPLADEVKETSLEVGRDILEAEEVMIKTQEAYRPVKKRELAKLLGPEIDKFIETLKHSVSEEMPADSVAAEVVVIGGLSLLGGLLEKMENDLRLPVRMGIVKGVADIPPSQASAFASAIGLLRMQQDAHSRAGSRFRFQGKNKIATVIDYITNLYQDYF